MKTRIILSLFLIATIFTGCKKDNSVDNLEVKQAEVDKTFKVTLNVLAKKDDTFSLYFTEDGTINFKDNPIWLPVKGSETPQDITFVLPESALPTQLRLDFGMAKDQEPIVIKNFKMTYLDKKFETPGDQFFIYFDPDLSKTIFDKATGTVTAVVKDGVKKSPSFYPNTKPLGDEIDKLIK